MLRATFSVGRWFKLTVDKLNYYASKTTSKPLGTIVIDHCAVIKANNSPEGGLDGCPGESLSLSLISSLSLVLFTLGLFEREGRRLVVNGSE